MTTIDERIAQFIAACNAKRAQPGIALVLVRKSASTGNPLSRQSEYRNRLVEQPDSSKQS